MNIDSLAMKMPIISTKVATKSSFYESFRLCSFMNYTFSVPQPSSFHHETILHFVKKFRNIYDYLPMSLESQGNKLKF